ncbi:MAG: hypothetical protein VXW00_13000, partial [Candidatus Latescibacterota bacterium]|nr:hypothetical protein [Candidatus Latescibacterota bacterium]
MRNTLKEIATSFYTFSKTGIFTPAIKDIASLSMDDAYQCQRMYQALRIQDGDKPFGYKVGCTSAAIRKQFGFDEPIYGRLMTPGLFEEGVPLRAGDYYSPAIEPEFVITLGHDLKNADASDEELLEAIEHVKPGMELHNYIYHYLPPSRQELI